MSLSDIVNVQITATSPGVTQAGFGVALILAVNAAWTERTRTYTDISGVATDFATTTPEYKAASAVFSQVPRPQRLMIGKTLLKPTQRRTITPTVANLTPYSIKVGTVTFTYTSDASAVDTEIVAGLIALINAGTDTLTASGTTTLILTGNTAGAYDNVEVLNPALLSLEQDHADPGVATDLAAIALEDSTWFSIINCFNSKAMVVAIAAWAEANGKMFGYATQDGPCILVAEGSATDVMKTLKTSAYGNTFGIYHPSTDAFADAAWQGKCLPLDPGSETWAHKTLATVPSVRLTSTHRINVLNKNGSVYEAVAGRNITQFGKVAAGEYIDVIRFIKWLTARIAERVFGLLSDNANPKIPYTDEGISRVAGNVRAQLSEGVAVGGLSSYTVSVPKVADVDPADKAARVLRNVNFTGQLQGAIHIADPIRGSVTV